MSAQTKPAGVIMMRICFIKLDHVHVKYVTLFMSDVCFYSRPLSQESGAMLLLSFVSNSQHCQNLCLYFHSVAL